MAGPSGQQPFVEDDSSSTVSFENVRLEKKSQRMTAARLGGDHDAPHSAENAVPDVLYVVQYRDYQGRVVETRKSDKPLDVALDAPQDAGGESAGGIQQRPVLEIITKVSTIRNAAGRHGQPFYRPRPRHGRAVYSSDDDEYRAYDARAGPASPVTRIETSEMIVHSHHLRNALNAVVTYYPELDLMGPTLRVEAPYRVLVLHMKELERYKLNQPQAHDEDYAQTTARHIDVLLAFLKSSLGDDIEREQRRWASSTPTATYDYFWLLLKPGEVVYHKVDGHWSPVVVSRVSRGYVDDDGRQRSGSYVVDCWYVEFVDGLMQRFMDSFVVPPFSGEQALRTLPVLPARFFPGGAEETRAKQVRLGRLYWELAKRPAYKEYDGPMIGKDSCPTGHLAGRVVVDCDGYDRFKDVRPSSSRLHRPLPTSSPRKNRTGPRTAIPPKDQLPDFAPRCPCAACQPTQRLPSKGGHLAGGEQQKTGPLAGFEDLDPNEDGPPDNELYFEVTVDYVPAFVLSQRRWAMLQVADLQDVRADREAFRHLVLDDEIKLTVKALIGKFASADGQVSPWPRDLVKNKGEGRIFLLHGSPGVGKTCTAECVAELTRRPLLALTSGDVSTSMRASSVEANLAYFLGLGERYGALVLLDEADVYLERRRPRDLRRNGLVSVFLRALEYYRGVLFLTTNRIGAFDGAFTSRIHVALHYRRLTDEDRRRIWEGHFERLERDSGGRCVVVRGAREFAWQSEEMRRLRLNGREIRNALQTAVALAETEAVEDGVEAVTVGEGHLRAVAKVSKGFKDFLRKRKAWENEAGEEDGEEEEEEEDDENDDDEEESNSDDEDPGRFPMEL